MIEVGSKVKIREDIPSFMLEYPRYRDISRQGVYRVEDKAVAKSPLPHGLPTVYIRFQDTSFWYEMEFFEDAYNSNLEKILT